MDEDFCELLILSSWNRFTSCEIFVCALFFLGVFSSFFCQFFFFLSLSLSVWSVGYALQTADAQFTPHIFRRYCQKSKILFYVYADSLDFYIIFFIRSVLCFVLLLFICVLGVCVLLLLLLLSFFLFVYFYCCCTVWCVSFSWHLPFVIRLGISQSHRMLMPASLQELPNFNGMPKNASHQLNKPIVSQIFIFIHSIFYYFCPPPSPPLRFPLAAPLFTSFRWLVCHWRFRWMSLQCIAHTQNAIKIRLHSESTCRVDEVFFRSFSLFAPSPMDFFICFTPCFVVFSIN